MSMRRKIEKAIVTILILGSVAGIGTHFYSRIQNSAPLPKFSFDDNTAPGWLGRESINVQEVARTNNYTGQRPIEKLPIADITVFQGQSEEEKAVNGCFVSYSYYSHTLDDIAAAYDDYFNRKDSSDGTLDTFEPIRHSIATFEGKKEFDLHQYRFVLEGQDSMQGYQIGFIPLSDGYIRTEGVCKTYEDLALTIPVLSAVELLKP